MVEKMTAHRAVYFMERFKHEEKLLGPNEQAALDFVISMLEAQPEQETVEQERKAFEQHWYDYYHCGSISPRTDGTYIHPAVQKAWEAWKARATYDLKGFV